MASTTTTTATTTETTTLLRPRRPARRASTSQPLPRRQSCASLPHSLEALDLSSASPVPTLISLRIHVLSYLADLETRLTQLDTSSPGLTLDEVRAWARDALDMLAQIRDDVSSYLPDFPLDALSVEAVKSHLPDMPDVRAHLPDVRGRIDDVRTRLADIDFHAPLGYLPTLSARLESLQAHLAAMRPDLAPSSMLSDMLDRLLSSDFARSLTMEPEEEDNVLERAAKDVAKAVRESMHGTKLIAFTDLPHQWRNNQFVTSGYRFIPLEKWPLILLSLFALHNETVNIHTHLIPFCMWLSKVIPVTSSPANYDLPERVFIAFALLCLFSSAVWHTMTGCAHPKGMDICARVDYVGIGWLISASVGTIVYYGFRDHHDIRNSFLALSLLTGIAGSVLPFMDWFNRREYKNYRIAFFLTLAFTALAPLAYLSYLHTTKQMLDFIGPVVPSLVSYLVGLAFYATHFPECVLSERWSHWLDHIGGGSHAIWHLFIVLAISQHRSAMAALKEGI